MRPGREMDTRIARDVFGHEVWATNKVLHEKTPQGTRPLRQYSREIESAWEVAHALKITLLPVEGGRWFAFSAPGKGWSSPQAFVDFLQKGNFQGCGAAVGENGALAICEAAIRALDKRANEAQSSATAREISASLQ